MDKKSIFFLIVIVLVIIAALIFSGRLFQTPKSKIGIILPLTGEVASLGEGAKNGAMLEYNSLPDKIKSNIGLLFEDDQFQPKNTVSAFHKLVDVEKVKAVICFTSSPCSAVAPLADQAKIPLIAVASAPVQKDKNYVFRLEISTVFEAKKLAEFVKQRNYKKIASIVAVQDGIQAGYAALHQDQYYSAHEVAFDSVTPTLEDFRTSIIKLTAQKPDVILVGLLPGMAGEFGKQARVLGYKGDFIAFNFIEGDETLSAAKGALDGIVYTQVADPVDWFNQKYQSAYNQAPGPGSAHLYDAITLLAPQLTSGMSSDSIVSYLDTLSNFNGALGNYSATGTHEFGLPVVLKTIKSNKFASYEN